MKRLTYVTDPHHLEGAADDPSIPGPGRPMARFIGSLVKFGSALRPQGIRTRVSATTTFLPSILADYSVFSSEKFDTTETRREMFLKTLSR